MLQGGLWVSSQISVCSWGKVLDLCRTLKIVDQTGTSSSARKMVTNTTKIRWVCPSDTRGARSKR